MRANAIPRRLAATVLVTALLSAAPARAAETRTDFEKGIPAGWKLSSSWGKEAEPVAELSKTGDKTELKLGRNALLTMGETPALDFSAETTIRRIYASSATHSGFQFRNGYRAYIRSPSQVELTGPNNARCLGFTRNIDTAKPIRFRIVVAGPVVRFFVNGQYEGQFNELALTPGPVALYQKGLDQSAFFDDVALNTGVEPAQYMVCEPVLGADQALVFDPAAEVSIKLNLRNHADQAQEARLGATVATFDGKLITEKQVPPETLAAKGVKEAVFNMGKLPEGFYRFTIQPTGETLPLAVQARGAVTHDQIAMPKILTGVYWYYINWGLPPAWANTYMHAACADLLRHNFNTIICQIGMPTEMIEIASQYGIRCFTRGEGAKAKGQKQGNVTHPNVIGGFIGDEPQKGQEEQYIKDYTRLVQDFPDKVWTTCVIGDSGVKGCQSWWDAWKPLSANKMIVPMFRWYGIKKAVSGIERRFGAFPPIEEILRDMTQANPAYYFIMPSFGSNKGIEAYYGNPLPSQIRCMMHLGAAFQAKGLFFWTYQTPFPDMDAFVDPATLVPLDGKWPIAGEAAGRILKNAELLAACTWGGRYQFVDGPALLECFELGRKDDTARYFYVVNKDCVKPASGRLFQLDLKGSLRDLFAERDVPITEETVQLMRPECQVKSGVASITLAPGDGVLLKYTSAAAGATRQAAAPRVVYPYSVAKAAADKIVWLAGVKPLEQPNPGWIPRIEYKGKVWFPDFNSHDLKLYSGRYDAGQLYEKSLYAHAETTIKYAIPTDAALFAAAAGFGNRNDKSSAIFRVRVDGAEKYNSGVMTIDSAVQPVVVDVSGGKLLELITDEAGDGLAGDYTFWGEARFIRK